MRFLNFFVNHMSKKYQNEKSTKLNGQKKSKTSEKVQKMRDLEGPTSFRPFKNTLYYIVLPVEPELHAGGEPDAHHAPSSWSSRW